MRQARKVKHHLIRLSSIGLIFASLSAANAQVLDRINTNSPLKEIVKNLDVNERAPDGSTPLHWAVYDVDVEKVKALIKAGADVNAANNYGANAMQLAAEIANIELLTLLLDAGADANSANPEGQTALMLVARTGDVDAAKLLVKHGASIDVREAWGQQTALMWASARRHPAMMAYLLKNGSDANAHSIVRDYKRHVTKEGRAKNLDSGGLTPLLYSIRENCISCVRVLIDHGADLNLPDPDGTSPLLLAILNKNWDIARDLIKENADIEQWDIFGRAPLFAAIANRSDSRIKINDAPNETDGLGIIQLLLEEGANPNMQLFFRPAKARGGPLSHGTTPLILAASSADLEVIRLLLEYHAEADLPQADRQTPISALMSARSNPEQLAESLQALLEAGANPNIMAVPHHLQRSRGGTPLHFAVRTRKNQMITLLVNAGADIDAKDIDGLTPLDHAMSHGQVGFSQKLQPTNDKMVDLLRELGATVALEAAPFWPNVGPPFYYPWSIFPLDPAMEAQSLVPGSIDHQ